MCGRLAFLPWWDPFNANKEKKSGRASNLLALAPTGLDKDGRIQCSYINLFFLQWSFWHHDMHGKMLHILLTSHL